MTYSAEISRTHPTCLLFVVDQSGSMGEAMSDGPTKAKFVADVLNRTLTELAIQCRKADDGGPRTLHYFDVGVVAYGGNGISSGLVSLPGPGFLRSIADIYDAPLRTETRKKKTPDGAGGLAETEVRFPVWFDPTFSGGTPMCDAIRSSAGVLIDWCNSHPNSYPPTVLHVTDGQATDGDSSTLVAIAEQLRNIRTNDGEALLFNLHISSGSGRPILFPATDNGLPDDYSRTLFGMSSILPQRIADLATERGIAVSSESRGFIFNSDADNIIHFFQIGTRPRLPAADR
jgi:hypothetical protein